MYHITCDGFPLLDWRDNDLILVDPKVKLEVNTVGEGSFTIYKNHPHFDKLKKLKSVFEVTDDNGVIFRGRATGDTTNFDHGMFVDLEGAMAFFNDSIVRSFNFPDDFLQDANYTAAANSGNVVAFFLGWLIDNHNDQVQEFQKMKLGTVTVRDPNNYLSRSSDEYASTWEVLKAKLFDSALGGYLCIRYEADGNYIDYLSEFTETNSQEIAYGENMLDLKRETEASEIYSAIIPIGVIGLTIAGLADRNVTDDIVKRGDTLYSKKAVEEYGWIYAPVSETTWEDVTDDANLLTKGAEWLADRGACLRAMEATAVDLHFADAQVESLRIYKNVNVRSTPHDVSEVFPLSKLEIDLLHPQNTKITVGKTLMPLTERTALLQEEAKKKYSKLSKTDDDIRLEVQDLSDGVGHMLILDKDGMIVTNADGEQVTISGGQIDAKTIKAEELDASKIKASDLQLSGVLSFGDLSDSEAIEEAIDSASTSASRAATSAANAAVSASKVNAWTYGDTTYIDGTKIMTGTVKASQLLGGTVGLLDSNGNQAGTMSLTPASSGAYAVELISNAAVRLKSKSGALDLSANYLSADLNGNVFTSEVGVNIGADPTWGGLVSIRGASIAPASNTLYLCGLPDRTWAAMYSYNGVITTSDRNAKNSIEDLPGKYMDVFDHLRPRRFKMNEGTSGRYHVGFIAQEVEKAMEIAGVSSTEFGGFVKDVDQDGNDIYMLRYDEFVGILLGQSQQLKAHVAKLEERIAELEKL